MNRLLFTLAVVVLMAAHGKYCLTLELKGRFIAQEMLCLIKSIAE